MEISLYYNRECGKHSKHKIESKFPQKVLYAANQYFCN